MSGDMFCFQRLEKQILKLNGDQPTPDQASKIMVQGFSCFIEYVKLTDARLNAILAKSRERTSFKWWIIDKVLPRLVVWVIVAALTFAYALSNHLVIAG